MKILFIRHAETETNVKELTHKTGDPVGLTELGKKQAQDLGKICKKNQVEIIFTSPEQRAVETADIIAKELNLRLEVLKGFAERNWGEWEGRSWPEIEKVLAPMSLEERYNFVPPEGESWREMEARLKEGLSAITNQQYSSVAAVTHEGALRGLMPLLHNSPRDSSFKYHFDNASVSVFEYQDGIFTELINGVDKTN